jgi:hypothetical protein
MSHIKLDRSHQADQRISWQSIPTSDLMECSSTSEIEAHHGPNLSLLSSVSRPPSRDGHDSAPAPNDESSILGSRSWSHDDAPVPNGNNQLLDEDDSLSPSVQDVIASTVNTAISNQSSQEDRLSIASNSSSVYQLFLKTFRYLTLVLIVFRLRQKQNPNTQLVSLHATAPIPGFPSVCLLGSFRRPGNPCLVFGNPPRTGQR